MISSLHLSYLLVNNFIISAHVISNPNNQDVQTIDVGMHKLMTKNKYCGKMCEKMELLL